MGCSHTHDQRWKIKGGAHFAAATSLQRVGKMRLAVAVGLLLACGNAAALKCGDTVSAL